MRKSIGLTILLSLLFVLSTFAISWAEDPTSLIVVRASNNTLWKATCDGTTCSLWSLISGQFAQQPTLTWDEKLRKYVLICVATTGTIWMSTFNADGSHNDNWQQLAGDTPSPVAVAGSDLKISDIHHAVKGNMSISSLSTCPTLTNLTYTTHNVDRFGFIKVDAVGGYSITNDVLKYIRICIDDASGGTTCDSNLEELTGAATFGGAFALQADYQVNPGSKTVYLKACRESGAVGTVKWDDLASTWHGWDY